MGIRNKENKICQKPRYDRICDIISFWFSNEVSEMEDRQ